MSKGRWIFGLLWLLLFLVFIPHIGFLYQKKWNLPKELHEKKVDAKVLSRQIRRTNVSREEVKASIKEAKTFLSKMEQHRLSLETQLHTCAETKGYVIPPTQTPQPSDTETKPPPLTQSQIDRREKDIIWVMQAPRQKPNYIWNPCVQFNCYRDKKDEPQKCKPNDPTDFSGDKDSPPCCVHLLRDMLVDVKDWLSEKKLEYWVHYGTLLGAIRDKAIIPWTADVDIAIAPQDFLQLIGDKDVKREMWARGYNYFLDGTEARGMGRLCFGSNFRNGTLSKWPKPLVGKKKAYFNDYPYMDIYLIRDHGERISTSKGPCKFLKEWIYPLGSVEFCGIEMPAPRSPEPLLAHLYGDWRKPLGGIHGKHKCK